MPFSVSIPSAAGCRVNSAAHCTPLSELALKENGVPADCCSSKRCLVPSSVASTKVAYTVPLPVVVEVDEEDDVDVDEDVDTTLPGCAAQAV